MGEWVDFKTIKQHVTMQMVLDHYGIKLRRSGKELRGKCPIHKGEGSDAFHVSVSKGAFNCFSCGAKGNVLDFVAGMEQCSLRDAALKLAEWFGLIAAKQPAGERSGVKAPERATKQEQLRETPANKPLGFALKGVDASHPYLATRGISRETAEVFGVGFFPGKGTMSRRVVIPIHDEQEQLVAYAGRAIDGSEPKYKLPAGFKKSFVLYNYHRAVEVPGSRVVVVEGFFDCLKVHQAGFDSVVGLMGCTLAQEQEELLVSGFNEVALLLDADEPGRRAAAEIAACLVKRVWVRVVEAPQGRQPDQLSSEQLREILGREIGGR